MFQPNGRGASQMEGESVTKEQAFIGVKQAAAGNNVSSTHDAIKCATQFKIPGTAKNFEYAVGQCARFGTRNTQHIRSIGAAFRHWNAGQFRLG